MIAPRRTQKPIKPTVLTYTVPEVAALTGIPRSTIYRHIQMGSYHDAPVFKTGTTVRISKVAIDQKLGIDTRRTA